MEHHFVVFDLETTGLDPNAEQITEIAAVVLNNWLNTVDEFQCYVSLAEGKELPEYVANITGLNKEFLAENGITEIEAITRFKNFLMRYTHGDMTFVAHHVPFDFSFLHKWEIRPYSFICTRVLSKLTIPTTSASLANLAAIHGFINDNHHSALHDARLTARLLGRLAPDARAIGADYRNVVINDKERPLSFIPEYAKVINK